MSSVLLETQQETVLEDGKKQVEQASTMTFKEFKLSLVEKRQNRQQHATPPQKPQQLCMGFTGWNRY